MTESEVEQVVLDVVRRYTQNESATVNSRFAEDLHLSDVGRQMLFASVAQAFVARGLSLPSQKFYLADFLACPTPAHVRDAIRVKAFGAKVRVLNETAPPPQAPATPGTKEPKAPQGKAKPAAKSTAAKKKAVKKPAPRAKPRPGKR
jgi:hypothetical protein